MQKNDFHFKKSRYDRPTVAKICGLAKEGRACDLGPGPNGQCPGRTQCHPLKSGDRWECSRPQTSGGKCSGPSPEGACPHRVNCVPVDTPRHSRKKWILSFFALMCATVVLLLSTPIKYQIISPGELSTKHGGINNNQCSDCHDDAIHQPLLILPRAFTPTNTSNNDKCLNCHEMGVQASLPHSVSSQSLSQLSKDIQTITNTQVESKQLQCTACHKEHRGSHGLLTEIESQQCDSCHQRRSTPFEDTHPEFVDYGVKSSNSALTFNHNKHFNQHFKKEQHILSAPQQCTDCHQSGSELMEVLPFAQSCASCHDKDVRSAKLQQPGVALLSLPSIDLDSLIKHNIHIGQWPEDVEDGELSALSMLSLEQQPRLMNLLTRIQTGDIDLTDLEQQNLQDLALVGELAWEIKKWLHQLQTQGHSNIQDITESALQLADNDPRSSRLVAGLPLSLVNEAQKLWFPSLQNELNNLKQQRTAITRKVTTRNKPLSSEKMQQGGWYIEDFALRYRPSGHSDLFMKQWLESTASAAKPTMAVTEIHRQLTRKNAPGNCSKCHALDAKSDSTISWASTLSDDSNRSFTRFSHAPHLSLEKQCSSCHQSSSSTDFKAINKQQCSSCHTQSLAGNDCLLCHNYHVNDMPALLPSTLLPTMTPTQRE